MNSLKISWKNIIHRPLTAVLNIVLVAFGIGVLTLLLLASAQVNNKLEANAKDIDLVVGAKGSPLQLILSSVYYIDFPTGNIPLKDAEALAANPMVSRAVPLALGDNYNGYRIVGTDTAFNALYSLQVASGRFWSEDFEATVGATVAAKEHLKPGDRIYGAHGLAAAGDLHKDHAYHVVGILQPKGNVTDNLVLTNVASVWKMHDGHEDNGGHEIHDGEEHMAGERAEINDREVTALLIQYRSPMSVVIFPRLVNESTNLQAASPAMESARLFSLIGVGIDTLRGFAVLIMAIAALSVFISLYSALKDRRYDIALMRTMGASRGQLFLMMILEGVLITCIGTLIGLLAGHAGLAVIGAFQDTEQARLNGAVFLTDEIYLVAAGIAIGIVASVLPAFQVYRTDISRTLSGA